MVIENRLFLSSLQLPSFCFYSQITPSPPDLLFSGLNVPRAHRLSCRDLESIIWSLLLIYSGFSLYLLFNSVLKSSLLQLKSNRFCTEQRGYVTRVRGEAANCKSWYVFPFLPQRDFVDSFSACDPAILNLLQQDCCLLSPSLRLCLVSQTCWAIWTG